MEGFSALSLKKKILVAKDTVHKKKVRSESKKIVMCDKNTYTEEENFLVDQCQTFDSSKIAPKPLRHSYKQSDYFDSRKVFSMRNDKENDARVKPNILAKREMPSLRDVQYKPYKKQFKILQSSNMYGIYIRMNAQNKISSETRIKRPSTQMKHCLINKTHAKENSEIILKIRNKY